MRSLIRDQFRSGTPFHLLAREYTMDGNPTGGSGNMMMQEIEAAVRLHGKGDIFTVDIPANRWHYVVYKSFADRFPMELLILKLKDDGR